MRLPAASCNIAAAFLLDSLRQLKPTGCSRQEQRQLPLSHSPHSAFSLSRAGPRAGPVPKLQADPRQTRTQLQGPSLRARMPLRSRCPLCRTLSLARGRAPEGRDPRAPQRPPRAVPPRSAAPGRLTSSRGHEPDPGERGCGKWRAGRRGGTAPTRPSARSRPVHRAEPGRLSQSGAAPPRRTGAAPTGAAPGRHDERSRGSTELTTAVRLCPPQPNFAGRSRPGGPPSPLAAAARPGRASGYLNVHRVPAQHPSHAVRTATAFPRLPAAPEWSGTRKEAEPAARAATPQWAGGHPAAPRASRGALRAGSAAAPVSRFTSRPRREEGPDPPPPELWALPPCTPAPSPSSFAFGKERRGSPDSNHLPPAGSVEGLLSPLHENVAANSAWDDPRRAFPPERRLNRPCTLENGSGPQQQPCPKCAPG